jgi:hypothetical protein
MTAEQIAEWNKSAAVYHTDVGYWGVFEMMVYTGGDVVNFNDYGYIDAYINSQSLVKKRNMEGKIDAEYSQPIVEHYQSLANYTGDLSMVLYKLDSDGLTCRAS